MNEETKENDSKTGKRMPDADRPAHEPGGCQCIRCGCIFIGEEWHELCAVCVKHK